MISRLMLNLHEAADLGVYSSAVSGPELDFAMSTRTFNLDTRDHGQTIYTTGSWGEFGMQLDNLGREGTSEG